MARPALAGMWTLKAFCSWGPLRFQAEVTSIGPPGLHQGYPGRQGRVLQLRKVQLRKVKWAAQEHTASTGGQDSLHSTKWLDKRDKKG